MEPNNTELINKGYKHKFSEGALNIPIFRSSTFCFDNAEEGERSFNIAYGKNDDKNPSLIYTRVNNPNIEILEERIAHLDNAESSVVFSSGMAAITTCVLSLLKPNDSLLYSEPVYGGTDHFFNHILPTFGIKCIKFQAKSTKEQIEKKIKSIENLKMIYIETPCNPTLDIISIKLMNQVRNNNVVIAVDSTMCGPEFLRPLSLGADLVIYSVTKFIGGHSDLVAGSVSGKNSLIKELRYYRCILGNIPDPQTCWLIKRSLATLKLRMKTQCENTNFILDYLQKLIPSKILKLYYPGINDNKQKKIFEEEYSGGGSMISFEINGTKEEVFQFLNKFKLVKLTVSLGGVETLIQHPSSMTHSCLTKEEKLEKNIKDNLVRMSIGLEEPQDIFNDLEQSFEIINCL